MDGSAPSNTQLRIHHAARCPAANVTQKLDQAARHFPGLILEERALFLLRLLAPGTPS